MREKRTKRKTTGCFRIFFSHMHKKQSKKLKSSKEWDCPVPLPLTLHFFLSPSSERPVDKSWLS